MRLDVCTVIGRARVPLAQGSRVAVENGARASCMRITVVTVSYNSASTIGDTLRCVAGQSHPDIEHILIDGGSTDGTLDIVRDHGGHLAKVVSERDRGIYDAMNKGLA